MALGSLRSDFRTFARQSSAPAQIVARLSTGFYEEFHGSLYVTCIVGTFDLAARTLTYANAGHPAGIVSGGNGSRYMNRGGPPAGLLPDVEFEQDLIELRAGDVCLLVTDGVTEALEGDISLERELEMARARPGAGAAELCHEVITRALNGHGPRDVLDWDDDRTVVVVTVSTTRTDAITPDDDESLEGQLPKLGAA
jgi:phosphoserine phosphatase RsbU/P